MKATVEKRERNRVSLHIEIEEPRVEKALQQAHRRLAQRFSVPGFRRGRVPRSVLERRLGTETLVQEAVDLLWPDVFQEAVAETGIEPISVASVDLAEEYVAHEALRLRAEVEVKPEVILHGYKGLAVERIVNQPTDADVEAVLERFRQQQAQLVSCENTALEVGHYATIDYSGLVDGEPFSGGAGKDTLVAIGEDNLFPGLSDGLVGAQPGETREVKVTLPDRFGELAGKEALLHVEVHEVKERQVPELDDEFAKDISTFDTLDELRADIRASLEKEAQREADGQMRNTLIGEASKQAELEIPDLLIERRARDMINDGAMSLAAQGIDPRPLLTTEYVDSLMEQYKPEAEEHVRRRLVLEAIADKEGITATSEELDERVEEWALQATDRAEEIRAYYEEPARRDALQQDVRVGKAVQFLVDNAVITEKLVDGIGEADPESTTGATE